VTLLLDEPATREEYARLFATAFRMREQGAGPIAPSRWEEWLRTLFPSYVRHPFGDRHVDFWGWVQSIEPERTAPTLVAIWPRGGAKSTSAELACCYLGAFKKRRYGWYISETQSQADDHVGNVASMLESDGMARYHPRMAERSVGKYGNSKGWRRERLRTADGFTLDALGLDTGARGIKLDEARPDFMILDDLDRQTDSPDTVARKISILTKSVLPAGADHLVVLAIQNLVHDTGIFARLAGLAEEPADFLADRIVSGPYPALLSPAYEERDGRWFVVSGEPTWEGQDRDACQRLMDRIGLSAFKVESQHEVDVLEGGLFTSVAFKHCRPEDVPDLVRVAVWVDPAVTETDKSDSHGIQADGIDRKKHVYRLRSWEGITSPRDSLRRALLWAVELGASRVGVETDQGGDTWRSVYREAWQSLIDDGLVPKDKRRPIFASEKAGAGQGPKVERAQRMLADYERGNITHVLGHHAILEKSLRRFPVREPFDLCDSAYWAWYDLRGRALRGVLGKSLHGRRRVRPDPSILVPYQTNASERRIEQQARDERVPRRRLSLMGRRG
jgi:hypothetical protein